MHCKKRLLNVHILQQYVCKSIRDINKARPIHSIDIENIVHKCQNISFRTIDSKLAFSSTHIFTLPCLLTNTEATCNQVSSFQGL